jgi:N-acetyl sugar amidotransferase
MKLIDVNQHLENEKARKKGYRSCSFGVLDNLNDPKITFDKNGICNYYYDYLKYARKFDKTYPDKKMTISEKVDEIKLNKSNSKYHCIIGLSGGVDSSYLCLYAKRQGLNPLIVHFDNGWNSELAQMNIEQIVTKLDFDLVTHVVDWDEFKLMQRAFIKASVVDIETLTDHAFMSTLYEQAQKWKIKYVLAGTNFKTEYTLPSYWWFNKNDRINIADIVNKNGDKKFKDLKTFPSRSPEQILLFNKMHKIKYVDPLNFIDYDPSGAKSELISTIGWREYSGKHHESIWTRFYQGYILPVKFNIDKRRAHLSDLIFSGKINRDDAQKILNKPTYDENLIVQDYEYILKKLDITESEFQIYLNKERVEHTHYDYDKGFKIRYKLLWKIAKFFK